MFSASQLIEFYVRGLFESLCLNCLFLCPNSYGSTSPARPGHSAKPWHVYTAFYYSLLQFKNSRKLFLLCDGIVERWSGEAWHCRLYLVSPVVNVEGRIASFASHSYLPCFLRLSALNILDSPFLAIVDDCWYHVPKLNAALKLCMAHVCPVLYGLAVSSCW